MAIWGFLMPLPATAADSAPATAPSHSFAVGAIDTVAGFQRDGDARGHRGERAGRETRSTSRTVAPHDRGSYGDRDPQQAGPSGRYYDRNRDGHLDRRYDRNDDNRIDRRLDHNRDGRIDRRYDYNRGNQSNRWHPDWRDDHRYNWRSHRDQYRNYYHPGRYYAPSRNYGYNRFSIGIRIGSPYYSSRYWIQNPGYYRLPPAYGSYRWIRYYDDVLLVDLRTGRVVDSVYDFFW